MNNIFSKSIDYSPKHIKKEFSILTFCSLVSQPIPDRCAFNYFSSSLTVVLSIIATLQGAKEI